MLLRSLLCLPFCFESVLENVKSDTLSAWLDPQILLFCSMWYCRLEFELYFSYLSRYKAEDVVLRPGLKYTGFLIVRVDKDDKDEVQGGAHYSRM